MLEITGTKEGIPASLVWNDGELIGTDWAILEFTMLVRGAAGKDVGYQGMEKVRDDSNYLD